MKRMSAASFCDVSQAGLAFGVIGWFAPLEEGVDCRLLFCGTLGMGIWGLIKGKSSVPQNGVYVQDTREMNGMHQ